MGFLSPFFQFHLHVRRFFFFVFLQQNVLCILCFSLLQAFLFSPVMTCVFSCYYVKSSILESSFPVTVTMFLLVLIQNTPSLKSSLFTKSYKLWTVFSTDDPRKQQHVHRGGAAVRPTCVGYQDPDRAFQWTCSHSLHAGGACGISLAWWVNLACFF